MSLNEWLRSAEGTGTVSYTHLNSNGGGNYPMEGIEGKEGVVNAALVNVRVGAGSDQEVMNTLKSGVSVLIEGAERDASGVIWYKAVSYTHLDVYKRQP